MKLSCDSIYNHLNNKNLTVECYDVISSTNTVLKDRGRSGAPHGLIIAAAEQTAGRGRMGRTFFSPRQYGHLLQRFTAPSLTPSILSADYNCRCCCLRTSSGKGCRRTCPNQVG